MAGEAVFECGYVQEDSVDDDVQASQDIERVGGIKCLPGLCVGIAFEPQRVFGATGRGGRGDTGGGATVASGRSAGSRTESWVRFIDE